VINRTHLYLDGAWVPAATSDNSLDVVDSLSETVFGTVPAGTPLHVDRAVRAAHSAFPAWSAETSPGERAKFLHRIADALEARSGELLDIIVRETGMAKGPAQSAQVAHAIGSFRIAADIAERFVYEHEVGASIVVREAIGVVACITPWNYPLRQIAAKVAFAMAAGCTVVLKPSEVAPLDAFVLADAVHEVGLPAGVFNLVSGLGPVVGEAMAAHPLVDMVSFTGSTRAGTRVAEVASVTVKRVALELGGKGPNLILNDLDADAFAAAVTAGVARCFPNSGQTCAALTRLLVPRERLGEAEVAAADAATAFVVGNPFHDGVKLGPLASAAHRDRVRNYINTGVAEGARIIAGGPDAPEGFETGFYVRPTVFSDVHPDMAIAREEIFGPVLVIVPYDDEDDAVRIANDTPYGLSAGVWSSDKATATRVARRLRAGQVEVNGGRSNGLTPFGGYKQSGLGREFGQYGFEEFLETKSLLL
jgi:acyl-CoA reductase-like NAD-dependent aldehyde dehydrogenase